MKEDPLAEKELLDAIAGTADKKNAAYLISVSELRYRRLFETAQDGILLVDFDTGMIMDVNKFLIDFYR